MRKVAESRRHSLSLSRLQVLSQNMGMVQAAVRELTACLR
jgi:hypothetical protein